MVSDLNAKIFELKPYVRRILVLPFSPKIRPFDSDTMLYWSHSDKTVTNKHLTNISKNIFLFIFEKVFIYVLKFYIHIFMLLIYLPFIL